MSDLYDFFKKKKEEQQNEQVNWKIVETEWLNQIELFMSNIKSWLEPFAKEGLLEILEKKIEIEEEHVGKYEATALEVVVGAERFKVTPVGRFIVGALGRIDITSLLGKFIVLNHSEKGWIYRNERYPSQLHPFTEENFTNMVKELV